MSDPTRKPPPSLRRGARITFVPDAGVRKALDTLAKELAADVGRPVTLSAALREVLARALPDGERDPAWRSGWREGFRAGYAEARKAEAEAAKGRPKHN